MKLTRAWIASLVLCSAVAAFGQDEPPAPSKVNDRRIDAATGRALGNYAPDRHFDHVHMRLEMVIPDMTVKAFSAKQTLTIAAIGKARSVVVLDARATLTVKRITIGGTDAAFVHADDKLTVTLPAAAEPGVATVLVIEYDAKDPFRDGVGLNWLKGRGENDASPPVIFSQGEASWNSYWFPCHDFPNEKLTTEIIVNVENGFEVISNGRLVSKDPVQGAGEADPSTRTVWHWLQDKPHSNYLVMLAVSKWDIVDLGGPTSKRPGMPITVYGKVGSAETLKKVFANTPAMITYFEEQFDEPYPWDKYAQVLVRNFRWGGMENTSATILGDFAGARGGDGSQDDLIAHELAHQWFGDLVTCKSWEHLWLNEGWATFAEAMWQEHRSGKEAYTRVIRNALNKQRGSNRGTLPGSIPMVSKLWKNPDETFEKADDVYSKGGVILHMLRKRLGDEVFWKATRLYLDRYKFACAETDDFRKVFEEVSGESLEKFFDQWCLRPGIPRLALGYEWDEKSRTLTVSVEQTQTVNGDNPAYNFVLPLWCASGEKEGQFVTVAVATKSTTASFVLPQRPERIGVDPEMTVAAQFRVTKKLDDKKPAADDGSEKAE